MNWLRMAIIGVVLLAMLGLAGCSTTQRSDGSYFAQRTASCRSWICPMTNTYRASATAWCMPVMEEVR